MLCCSHFNPDTFKGFNQQHLIKDHRGQNGFRRRLKPDAVPSIFPHKVSKQVQISSESHSEKREKQEETTITTIPQNIKEKITALATNQYTMEIYHGNIVLAII